MIIKSKVMKHREFLKSMEELTEAFRAQAEGVPAFEDNSPAARRERIRKARGSVEYFRNTYLPGIFEAPPADFHFELDKKVNTPNKRMGISGPRGGAKTARGIDINSLRDFLLGLEEFSIIVADTYEIGVPKLVFIKVQCESNPRILADFGTIEGSKWDEDYLVNKQNGCAIRVTSFRKPVRGLRHGIKRPTKAWIDDLENEESALNPDQCKKRLRYVEGAIRPAMAANKRSIIWLGTILSPYCAFKQFLDKKDEDDNFVYDRIIVDALQENDSKSFWPEMMPVDWLLKERKELGPYQFNKEYMNKCRPEDAEFKSEWFENRYSLAEKSADWLKTLHIYRAIDPAGGSKKGDFAASITVGLDLKKYRFYVLQVLIKKITPLELINAVREQQRLIPAAVTFVEDNMHKNLLEPLIRDSDDGKTYKTKVPTQAVTSVSNKFLRIMALQSPIQNGWYCFDPTIGDTKKLIEQFEYFPKAHDDGPDAMSILHKEITDLVARSGFQSESSGPRESAKVTKGW